MVCSQPIGPFGLQTYVPRRSGGPDERDTEKHDQDPGISNNERQRRNRRFPRRTVL